MLGFRKLGNFILIFLVAILEEESYAFNQACSPKACKKTDNQKVVCGSDGLSYPNRCQLERVRCQNENVTFVKRGPCKKQRSCLEWQDLSLDFPQFRFKARCKKNGSYEPGQCHPESGYCWCVTSQGVPLPDTVKEKNKKPGSKPIRCGLGFRKKIARSPSRKTKTRICRQPEKSIFNNRLMNSFHSEYKRDFNRNNTDEIVIMWKFNSLDANRDDILDKREYRDIKRIVGKAMKPKKCAKNFPKSCDVDSDGKITLMEWRVCLPRDGHSDGNKSEDSQEGGSIGGGLSTTDDSEDYDVPYEPVPSSPDGLLNPDLSALPPTPDETDDFETKEEESPGCLGDRKSALEEVNLSGHLHNATLYVPECTPDGRYKKVQCYKSVGYCWCVNEDTGQTITGTSVKGGNPNCSTYKPQPRPMKGCPDDKKIVFLQDLMQFLRSKMDSNADLTNPAGSLALIQSKEEQALWSFNLLDKNRNKILEKTEWKAFKEMVANVKGLKKCGKKLPRYCDMNKDKEISTTEWLDCLSVQVQPSILKTSRFGERPNPLSVLKE
ncbi:hypothetical protein ABEB36_001327 [Hypothenemus hampei]|uniref:SPARC-related modular calcium-binding protein 2 n=1 Tax=Hypothenemus hampei TaxID=57062 RepID=A0ABD1FE97_HYPHA